MGAIYRRELGSFFNSALGWVFLTVFYLGAGVLLCLFTLVRRTADMAGFFSWMRLIMVLVLPLLTMPLLSEERGKKTDQGLLTAPVSLTGIVMGKYLAALTLYAIGIAIFFLYALILSFFGAVTWSIVISNVIALFLLGAAFMAITLFFSSLTENQFIAYIIGLGILLFLYMFDWCSSALQVWSESLTIDVLSNIFSGLSKAMSSVSFYTRIYDFAYGLFDVSGVLLYVSTAVLFNFFTVRVLEARRWK